MSLLDVVTDVLDGEGWPYVWGRDFETEVDWKAAAPILIAALAARGIDLELAYQWQRVDKALPEGWRLAVRRTDEDYGVWAATAVSAGFFEGENEDDYCDGNGPTPAAALSALADALETQK